MAFAIKRQSDSEHRSKGRRHNNHLGHGSTSSNGSSSISSPDSSNDSTTCNTNSANSHTLTNGHMSGSSGNSSPVSGKYNSLMSSNSNNSSHGEGHNKKDTKSSRQDEFEETVFYGPTTRKAWSEWCNSLSKNTNNNKDNSNSGNVKSSGDNSNSSSANNSTSTNTNSGSSSTTTTTSSSNNNSTSSSIIGNSTSISTSTSSGTGRKRQRDTSRETDADERNENEPTRPRASSLTSSNISTSGIGSVASSVESDTQTGKKRRGRPRKHSPGESLNATSSSKKSSGKTIPTNSSSVTGKSVSNKSNALQVNHYMNKTTNADVAGVQASSVESSITSHAKRPPGRPPKSPKKRNTTDAASLDMLHEQTVKSIEARSGKRLSPAPGCVDSQLSSGFDFRTLPSVIIKDSSFLSESSMEDSLNNLLGHWKEQILSFLNVIQMPDYKVTIQKQIDDEKVKNQSLTVQVDSMERSIKALQESGVQALKSKLNELGITSSTAEEVLDKARNIIAQNKLLIEKEAQLQTQVTREEAIHQEIFKVYEKKLDKRLFQELAGNLDPSKRMSGEPLHEFNERTGHCDNGNSSMRTTPSPAVSSLSSMSCNSPLFSSNNVPLGANSRGGPIGSTNTGTVANSRYVTSSSRRSSTDSINSNSSSHGRSSQLPQSQHSQQGAPALGRNASECVSNVIVAQLQQKPPSRSHEDLSHLPDLPSMDISAKPPPVTPAATSSKSSKQSKEEKKLAKKMSRESKLNATLAAIKTSTVSNLMQSGLSPIAASPAPSVSAASPSIVSANVSTDATVISSSPSNSSPSVAYNAGSTSGKRKSSLVDLSDAKISIKESTVRSSTSSIASSLSSSSSTSNAAVEGTRVVYSIANKSTSANASSGSPDSGHGDSTHDSTSGGSSTGGQEGGAGGKEGPLKLTLVINRGTNSASVKSPCKTPPHKSNLDSAKSPKKRGDEVRSSSRGKKSRSSKSSGPDTSSESETRIKIKFGGSKEPVIETTTTIPAISSPILDVSSKKSSKEPKNSTSSSSSSFTSGSKKWQKVTDSKFDKLFVAAEKNQQQQQQQPQQSQQHSSIDQQISNSTSGSNATNLMVPSSPANSNSNSATSNIDQNSSSSSNISSVNNSMSTASTNNTSSLYHNKRHPHTSHLVNTPPSTPSPSLSITDRPNTPGHLVNSAANNLASHSSMGHSSSHFNARPESQGSSSAANLSHSSNSAINGQTSGQMAHPAQQPPTSMANYLQDYNSYSLLTQLQSMKNLAAMAGGGPATGPYSSVHEGMPQSAPEPPKVRRPGRPPKKSISSDIWASVDDSGSKNAPNYHHTGQPGVAHQASQFASTPGNNSYLQHSSHQSSAAALTAVAALATAHPHLSSSLNHLSQFTTGDCMNPGDTSSVIKGGSSGSSNSNTGGSNSSLYSSGAGQGASSVIQGSLANAGVTTSSNGNGANGSSGGKSNSRNTASAHSHGAADMNFYHPYQSSNNSSVPLSVIRRHESSNSSPYGAPPFPTPFPMMPGAYPPITNPHAFESFQKEFDKFQRMHYGLIASQQQQQHSSSNSNPATAHTSNAAAAAVAHLQQQKLLRPSRLDAVIGK